MKQRVISGAILAAVLIPVLLLGGYITSVSLAIVSLIGIFELLRVFKLEKSLPAIVSYIACILYYLNLAILDGVYSYIIIIGLFIALLICVVLKYPGIKTGEIALAYFSFIYAGILLSFVYNIRILNEGIYLVWMIFIASWICDTCAYFSGVFLGKHKAFPVLSPKKTWEGCAGGIIGSVLVSLIYAVIFNDNISVFNNIYIALPVITVVSAVISMFGDLAASAIKREYGIKDYSNLIPGHGGIMDRFDSVIFVAPVVYFMIVFLMA